ncbi:MAG: hypothetical protein WDW38_008637 [Sanguina aurantia]
MLLPLTAGFKPQDFKTCATASFCNRNRGNNSNGVLYSITPNSVSLKGAVMAATLSNAAMPSSLLTISMIAYQDGYIRLLVDEDTSVGRYKVPDIIMPANEDRRSSWTLTKQDAHCITLSLGDVSVLIVYTPFKIAVLVKGIPTLSVNSRNMFNFEQRRTKQEGDPAGWWDESFNGHLDSKPKGPESMSLDLSFPGCDHVYGLPERATSLALKATTGLPLKEPYRLYNLDVFEYLEESPFGLYGAIPMMLAHKAGLTTGVFCALPFPGPTALPQMFSIGYHQCRWNYKDEADVTAVDAGFDTHEIPYDVLWLDIEHTNGKRYLTWDAGVFPNPIAMQDDVASRGRKMVTIVDPHVKRDHNYYIFKEAEAAGYYVKNRNGGDFDGWCWPGASSYLDVSSPHVREWWNQQFALDKYQGSTKHLYIWNDMNEPSVFNGPEITMPKDNIHYGGIEHRDLHNVYGLHYHQATADGLALRGRSINPESGDRPFVLSRAFFAGTQRVGPIWTGDNAAEWAHLKVSVPMLLTLGLTGLPNSGADVGGFFGNPSTELLTRWYQMGTFYPFFRGHAHLEAARREPWLFGEPHTTRIRDAIRARYTLLPYIYTLFREANVTGLPLMRPLWFEFPSNKDTFSEQESFMLGPAMLVRPVVVQGASAVDVLLPRESRWYDSMTGAEASRSQTARIPVTMDSIPSYYRGGSVIPRRERPRRSTATMASDPYTLVVALDEHGEARGDLFTDDGSSYAYQAGAYTHRRFHLKGRRLSSTPETVAPGGVPSSPDAVGSGVLIERIVFLGLPNMKKGSPPPKVRVSVGGGEGVVVDLEVGPLSQRAPGSRSAAVLRAPGLRMGEDWRVELL